MPSNVAKLERLRAKFDRLTASCLKSFDREVAMRGKLEKLQDRNQRKLEERGYLFGKMEALEKQIAEATNA